MKVTPFVIDRFAKFILGGVVFENIKRIVTDINSASLTGAQKRDKVVRDFAVLGYAVAGFLLNLGIELAVTWLKSKEGK